MSDQAKKDSFKEPQEEFIDEGIPKNKKAGKGESDESPYEDLKMDELHKRAQEKGITNFVSMNKKELIERLKQSNKETD